MEKAFKNENESYSSIGNVQFNFYDHQENFLDKYIIIGSKNYSELQFHQ